MLQKLKFLFSMKNQFTCHQCHVTDIHCSHPKLYHYEINYSHRSRLLGKLFLLRGWKDYEGQESWFCIKAFFLKVIPLKLFLDHSRLQKSQGSLEVANPVMRILLTWTAQAAFHAFSSILHENIHATRVVIFAEELGTVSNNNSTGIYLSNKAYMED